MKIQIWKGFKFSAYKYSDQCALILDDCCRFMSTETALDRIDAIYDELERSGTPNFLEKFQDACRQEFIGQTVIANYGNKRMYVVVDIRFEHGPCQETFELKDGTKMSIAEYFLKTYQLGVTAKKQPMLVVNAHGRNVKIPAEFCLKDGVP